MKIAGIEKCSFVDYPGHLAAVFFTWGCNLNCYYCHNRSLLGKPAPPVRPWFDTEAALALLEERRGLLDSVVITGGEPTLQKDLAEFIRQVRALGYLVKLDTNGTRPHVVRALLDEGLLDYVAMDVKAPLDKYEAMVGAPVNHDAIHAGIDLLLAGRVDYEFRTTVVPQLYAADILAIARRIRGSRRYVLQQYRRPPDGRSDPRLDAAPHGALWAYALLDELRGIVDHVETRGFGYAARGAHVGVA